MHGRMPHQLAFPPAVPEGSHTPLTRCVAPGEAECGRAPRPCAASAAAARRTWDVARPCPCHTSWLIAKAGRDLELSALRLNAHNRLLIQERNKRTHLAPRVCLNGRSECPHRALSLPAARAQSSPACAPPRPSSRGGASSDPLAEGIPKSAFPGPGAPTRARPSPSGLCRWPHWPSP